MQKYDKARFAYNNVLFKRALRFALVGIFITGIHIVIAILSIQKLTLPPPLANGLAFIVATFISFIINTIWSFSTQLCSKTLFRFIVVSLFGFLWAMLIALIFQNLGLNYLIGIGVVATTLPLVSFVLHNFWTYK